MRIGQVGFVKFTDDDYTYGLFIEATPEELAQLQAALGFLRHGDHVRVVKSQHCKCGVELDPKYPELCESCGKPEESCGGHVCNCRGKHGEN